LLLEWVSFTCVVIAREQERGWRERARESARAFESERERERWPLGVADTGFKCTVMPFIMKIHYNISGPCRSHPRHPGAAVDVFS